MFPPLPLWMVPALAVWLYWPVALAVVVVLGGAGLLVRGAWRWVLLVPAGLLAVFMGMGLLLLGWFK